MVVICAFKPDPSLTVTEHAMTGLDTPVARPKAKMKERKTDLDKFSKLGV